MEVTQYTYHRIFDVLFDVIRINVAVVLKSHKPIWRSQGEFFVNQGHVDAEGVTVAIPHYNLVSKGLHDTRGAIPYVSDKSTCLHFWLHVELRCG